MIIPSSDFDFVKYQRGDYGDHCIIHGDCRDVLPSLQGATVITDPPYNVGYHYDGYGDKLSEENYNELLKVTCRVPSVVIHYPESLFALSWLIEEIPSDVVAWVYNSNIPHQWRGIAWFGTQLDLTLDSQDYKNPTDKRVARYIADGKSARLYDWWNIQQIKNVNDEKTGHPCQIPLDVMLRVVKTTPCDLIVDPFLGSGTTLVAAKNLGRRAIGIEINRQYAEIAERRLAQEVLELNAPPISVTAQKVESLSLGLGAPERDIYCKALQDCEGSGHDSEF